MLGFVGVVLVLLDDAYASQANDELRLRMGRQKWADVLRAQEISNKLDDAEIRTFWRRAFRVAHGKPSPVAGKGSHGHHKLLRTRAVGHPLLVCSFTKVDPIVSTDHSDSGSLTSSLRNLQSVLNGLMARDLLCPRCHELFPKKKGERGAIRRKR